MLFAGDTDTNGAIVGGMIGAYYGRESLPNWMVDKVLKCDLNLGTHPKRPVLVQPTLQFQTRFN